MRRFLWLFLLFPVLLPGCGSEPKEPGLAGFTFERGSGSVWGNQLYMEVYPGEIALLRDVPEGASQQRVCTHVPITAEQWQHLTEAIRDLELKEKRGSWRQALFGGAKQDGGEYRNLSLLWETQKGVVEKTYRWPQSAQADHLETLLEQLAAYAGEQNPPA